jgi:hypothetical protein
MDRNSIVRGVEGIEEAAMLLRRIRFSLNRPAYAEGKRVAVGVDPRLSDDNETMRVLITCYGLQLQQVDWEGLRINIERREGDHSIAWLAFLNARGQAVRDGLPRGGEYSLSLPCRVKSQIVGQALSTPRRRIRRRGSIKWDYQPDETESSSIRGEEAALREAIIQEGRALEGALVWRVRETEEGEVQVSFEANEEFARQRLSITVIESISGRVQYSGVLTLVPATTVGKWEGSLTLGKSTEVKRPGDLILEALSPADQEAR